MKSNEREKVKCPKCNVEVIDGNFCEHCGAKLKQVCDCWVLKKKYNCGFDECKGYKLLIDRIKVKSNEENKEKRKSPRITIKIHGDLNMDKLIRLFKIANGNCNY